MIYEIRNYHFRPDLFAEYKALAQTEALPYLAGALDLVGFWFKTDDPAQVRGAPLDDLGTANVTWIIRWLDMAHRNEVFPRVMASPEMKAFFAQVPGGMASYLRAEIKFAESFV